MTAKAILNLLFLGLRLIEGSILFLVIFDNYTPHPQRQCAVTKFTSTRERRFDSNEHVDCSSKRFEEKNALKRKVSYLIMHSCLGSCSPSHQFFFTIVSLSRSQSPGFNSGAQSLLQVIGHASLVPHVCRARTDMKMTSGFL